MYRCNEEFVDISSKINLYCLRTGQFFNNIILYSIKLILIIYLILVLLFVLAELKFHLTLKTFIKKKFLSKLKYNKPGAFPETGMDVIKDVLDSVAREENIKAFTKNNKDFKPDEEDLTINESNQSMADYLLEEEEKNIEENSLKLDRKRGASVAELKLIN